MHRTPQAAIWPPGWATSGNLASGFAGRWTSLRQQNNIAAGIIKAQQMQQQMRQHSGLPPSEAEL